MINRSPARRRDDGAAIAPLAIACEDVAMLVSGVLAAQIAFSSIVLPGAAQLWARPEGRYVFVGEPHGTNEAPRLFADLICAAHARGRPVIAAVEHDSDQQRVIDEFTRAPEGQRSRVSFLRSPMWRPVRQDGRSSEAYLALFSRLRSLLHAKVVERVIAFRALPRAVAGISENPNMQVNRGMAGAPEEAARSSLEAIIVVLTGSTHAYRRSVSTSDASFQPAAALLPSNQVRSVDIAFSGGHAWNCRGLDCGAHALPDAGLHPRGVVIGQDLADGFDGLLYAGSSATPSPPAIAQLLGR